MKIPFVILPVSSQQILIFTRDTRMTYTRQKKRTTRTTPPTPTRNMVPRRKPPRRGNNPPNPKVLPTIISSEGTRLTSLNPQWLRVHLVLQRSPTPTRIMAPDPRRRRELVREMKLGCPLEVEKSPIMWTMLKTLKLSRRIHIPGITTPTPRRSIPRRMKLSKFCPIPATRARRAIRRTISTRILYGCHASVLSPQCAKLF